MAGFPRIGPRTQKVLRGVAYVAFALVVFVFALQMSFPYDRVREKIIEAASDKYDVDIASSERGILPGRVSFSHLTLRTRPAQADLDRISKIDDPKERDKQRAALITMIYVEKLDVHLGIFALLRGKASVDIDAKIGSGHITGNVTIGKGGTTVDLEGNDLPARSLPMKEAFSGLPMGGKVRFDFELDLPNETNKAGRVAPDWTKAEGELTFECPSKCTLGDGEAKFHPKVKNPRNEATVKEGVKFGTINIDSFLAKVELKKGTLEVAKFDMQSRDVELKLQLTMNLAQDLGESMVAGCARYKPTDALSKREGDTFSAFMLIGGPLGPDSLFHVKLDGHIKDLKKLALVCGPAANTNMDDPGANNGSSGGKASAPRLNIPQPEPEKVNPPPVPMRAPGPEHEENKAGSGSGSGSAGSGSSAARIGAGPPPPTEGSGSGSAEPEGSGSAAPVPN